MLIGEESGRRLFVEKSKAPHQGGSSEAKTTNRQLLNSSDWFGLPEIPRLIPVTKGSTVPHTH